MKKVEMKDGQGRKCAISRLKEFQVGEGASHQPPSQNVWNQAYTLLLLFPFLPSYTLHITTRSPWESLGSDPAAASQRKLPPAHPQTLFPMRAQTTFILPLVASPPHTMTMAAAAA